VPADRLEPREEEGRGLSRRGRWLAALLAALAIAAGAAWLLVFRTRIYTRTLPKTPVPELPVAFPPGFDFGFATVAYQSEGTLRSDGTRVSSNWSEWEDLGKVARGERNDRGNGFLEAYEADLDRAASLGATAFSYAIDWARLEPERGRFDEAEIARVVRIVEAIRARHMRPLVVLFHWVTPTWVQSPKTGEDLLSRPDRAFVDAFLPLVDRIVPPLAGLVDDWVTLEEPYSIVGAEYLEGSHPPGRTLAITAANRALVNLMYLHARVYRRIHALDTIDADGDGVAARVGFENIALECVPLDVDSPDDRKAAERLNYVINHQFLTAVWKGDIDLDYDGEARTATTDPPEAHVPELARTLDFIGINYYQRLRVEAGGLYGWIPPLHATPHADVREYDPDAEHSDMGQEISALGLRRVIEEYARYGLPLVITENGLADDRDDRRQRFLLDHAYVVARAIADGFDVRGYYGWTIADNFEWDSGRAPRFGLFAVDFDAPGFPRRRTRSADVFEAIAKGRRIDRALWERFAPLSASSTSVPR
jgi:beta-glucosidase/6-phospho-beta-glucosidase/beta-galactosidase